MKEQFDIKYPALFLLIFLFGYQATAQIDAFFIEPKLTDNNYSDSEAAHFVIDNTNPSTNQLLLFIGGTGSIPINYGGMAVNIGHLGFDVISISYDNDLPAAAFSNSSDISGFNNFRQHICYGTPLTFLQVDSLNSIYTRTVKLLNYLDVTYPNQRWDQYITNDTMLNWDKIIVGGHSQGAGHACYFGKFETPERVLMFSGPNDYSDFYDVPADWLSMPGTTPSHKHYSYIHLFDDVVDYSKQVSVLEALDLYPQYDTTLVETSNPLYNFSHCLYTKETSGSVLPHNRTVAVNDTNLLVWTYMLTSDISTAVHMNNISNDISIYPNPFTDQVTVSSDLTNYKITVYDALGNLIQDYSNVSNALTIDLTLFGSGIYFIAVQHPTNSLLSIHKIIKE